MDKLNDSFETNAQVTADGEGKSSASEYEALSKMGTRTTVTMYLFFAALLFCLLFIAHYSFTFGKSSISDSNYNALDGWVRVEADGTETPIPLTSDQPLESSDRITIETTLPDDFNDNASLEIATVNDMIVSIDGKERLNVRNSQVNIPGGVCKSVYSFVDLSREDCGKTLRIEKIKNGTQNAIHFTTVYIGSPLGLVFRHTHEEGLFYFTALILLIISFLVIGAGVVLSIHYHEEILLVPIGTAIFCTAMWLLLDSYMFQFVFGRLYVDGATSYMISLLIPIPFVYYVSSLLKRRYKLLALCASWLCLGGFIVFTFLHMTGIRQLSKNTIFIDLIIGITTISLLVMIGIDIKMGHAREYVYSAIGMIGFALLTLADMVLLNLIPSRQDGLLVIIGLFFLLGFSVAQQIHDIGLMKAEKDEARRSDEAKTMFLKAINDEIRGPLNTIKALSELILRENTDGNIGDYAGAIERSSSSIEQIMEDILFFSEDETKSFHLVEVAYSTATLITDMIHFLENMVKDKELETDVIVSRYIPVVLNGDITHIRQIITNLLGSAYRNTSKGKITLVFDMEPIGHGSQCNFVIRVQDTGTKRNTKLFDKNASSLDAGYDKDGSPQLTVTKMLAEALNGTIHMESKTGKGTTITVKIPQLIVDEMPLGPKFDEKMNPGSKKHEALYQAPEVKVLLVDDTKANLILVKELLKRNGITSETVICGMDAIDMCGTWKYDLIIMDQMMPDLSGTDTLHLIREDKNGPNFKTPAIMLTANTEEGAEKECYEKGFAGFLPKPVEAAKLEKLIKELLPEDKIV